MDKITLYVIKNPKGWWDLELFYTEGNYVSESQFYLYCPVKEAIKQFKKKFNLRYKHGIKIIYKGFPNKKA